MPSLINTQPTFVEGECQSKDLIYKLADEITKAKLLDENGNKIPNNWTKKFDKSGLLYAKYKVTDSASTSMKMTINGVSYQVYQCDIAKVPTAYVSSGYLKEVKDSANNLTGAKVPVDKIDIQLLNKDGSLKMNGGNPTTQSISMNGAFFIFKNNGTVLTPYVVERGYYSSDDTFVSDNSYNGFRLLGICTDTSWGLFYNRTIYVNYTWNGNGYTPTSLNFADFFLTYNSTYKVITVDPIYSLNNVVGIEATPNVPNSITPVTYSILLEQPMNDYNRINITYGMGLTATDTVGDPSLSITGILDPATVKPGQVPTIIDPVKAYLYAMNPTTFTAYKLTWAKDYDGVTDLSSPPMYYYHGRDSTVSYLVNKKRRPDYIVRYSMSINNNRVALVIEGDPAPSITDYYRSFAYIGKIVPFNSMDHVGNFGVTLGMGDLDPVKTGFQFSDISTSNPVYTKWGEYTSNGMYTFSMFNTAGKVFFQAYYPSFLTQLPNYPSVGTIPKELSRLVVENNGFQKSAWTGKYHASPVYLVHKAEGYRGHLDGVVAIYDHNLVNGDELIVETDVPKDPKDLSQGYYQEVYKFYSMSTPVNFFSYSPAPGEMSIAILKEIK